MVNFIILFLIASYMVFVIRKLRSDRKKGVCTGCTGKDCASCKAFSDSYFDDLIKKAKENGR